MTYIAALLLPVFFGLALFMLTFFIGIYLTDFFTRSLPSDLWT